MSANENIYPITSTSGELSYSSYSAIQWNTQGQMDTSILYTRSKNVIDIIRYTTPEDPTKEKPFAYNKIGTVNQHIFIARPSGNATTAIQYGYASAGNVPFTINSDSFLPVVKGVIYKKLLATIYIDYYDTNNTYIGRVDAKTFFELPNYSKMKVTQVTTSLKAGVESLSISPFNCQAYAEKYDKPYMATAVLNHSYKDITAIQQNSLISMGEVETTSGYGIGMKFAKYELGYFRTRNKTLQTYVTIPSKAQFIKDSSVVGVPYTLDPKLTVDDIGNSPDIYVPETDKNGYTTGNSNPSNSDKAKNDPKMADNYDPIGSTTGTVTDDPNATVTSTDTDPQLDEKIKSADENNRLPTINLFNRTFALTVGEVRSLADELWNADDTRFEEIKNGLALMGGNPIQGLIDLRLYPIDFTKWTGNTQKIVVGRTSLDTQGRLIETNTLPQFSCSLGTIQGQYGNFMDYEPFSIFQIYLPFVGTTDIPANLVIGHEISCKSSVDIITGAISYIVKADGYPILYKNGTIGVSIPMTADNAAEYALGVIHATNNVVQTGADTVKTVAKDVAKATSVKGAITDPSSNVAGAVSAGADIVAGASAIATAGVDLSTTVNQTTIQQSGTASPSNSLYTSMSVYILQEYHNPVIPSNYAHDIGIACRLSGSVGSFSGYTQFSNVDLTGINCTESERTIILETLQNGVYL